jgi:hypothetical protein
VLPKIAQLRTPAKVYSLSLKGKASGDVCSSSPQLSEIERLRAGVHFSLVDMIHAFEARRYRIKYYFGSLIVI